MLSTTREITSFMLYFSTTAHTNKIFKTLHVVLVDLNFINSFKKII